MEWTDISITVAKRDADTAEAIATMVANGGIYIEDYSDLEQQAWEIAHVDLIEQELLDKPRDVVIVHMYLAPDENPAEVLPLFEERLKNSGIDYQLNTAGVEQEDWQNAWKKYYHAMDIGSRLAIVPGWEQHDTDRIKIVMDPGMAFGTGTHETTSLCLETLDELVQAMRTKRYATARLRRLVLDAALGYTGDLPALPPYLHVLGANETGLAVLRCARQAALLPLSHSLADLAARSAPAARVAAAHAAAEDLTALCLRHPAPMGAAYTAKPVFPTSGAK